MARRTGGGAVLATFARLVNAPDDLVARAEQHTRRTDHEHPDRDTVSVLEGLGDEKPAEKDQKITEPPEAGVDTAVAANEALKNFYRSGCAKLADYAEASVTDAPCGNRQPIPA